MLGDPSSKSVSHKGSVTGHLGGVSCSSVLLQHVQLLPSETRTHVASLRR